jgi:hypothetical protein
MMVLTESSIEHQLPFDSGLKYGVLTYLKRISVYATVLAINLAMISVVYLSVRFPMTVGWLLAGTSSTCLVWLLIRDRGTLRRLKIERASAKEIYSLATEKFAEAERYRIEAEFYARETSHLKTERLELLAAEQSLKEAEARLQLFRQLEKFGLILLWNAAGDLSVVSAREDFDWRRFYSDFALEGGLSGTAFGAHWLKSLPILDKAAAKSINNLAMASVLIGNSARWSREPREVIHGILSRLEHLRVDFSSIRLEHHEVIFRAWVPENGSRETEVWVRVLETDNAAKTSLAHILLDAMGAGLLKVGIIELGPTSLAVVGESESDIYGIQRVRP